VAGDERPLVYVSFGSVAASLPPAAAVYARALEAVADLPIGVLRTVGKELELSGIPSNVHVERWVPQAQVLGRAAAVVCHGGSGTTLAPSAQACRWSSCRSSPTSRTTPAGWLGRERGSPSRSATFEVAPSACSKTTRTVPRPSGSPTRCAAPGHRRSRA
jgi:hypothetical protein